MKAKTLSLIALLLVGTCINSFAQRGGRGNERGGRAQTARTVRSHVQTGVSRIVYDLPVEADKVQIDGKTYFQQRHTV